jgi:hypothetical protein
VHAVGHLVGLDPDQRRLDAVDAGHEAVELDSTELFRIGLLHARVEEAPELRTASDEVLPQPALRLVNAERARAAGREPFELTRELVCVEAVPVLVHRREERLHRLRVVVGGDPDVVHPGA